MMASKSFFAVIVAAISLFAALRLKESITNSAMKYKPSEEEENNIIKVGSLERLSFFVEVEGLKLHSWLYMPPKQQKEVNPPAVVVAAYGLGVQKDMSMVPFAQHIAEEGFAVVIFDYRHWGVSEGTPRHVANPHKEIEDLKAVLQHLHASNGLGGRVDQHRIMLYGASLGGALVLATASLLNKENNKIKDSIKAVVAAIPFVSGRNAQNNTIKQRGLGEALGILWAVLNDVVMSFFSTDSAVYIPIARPTTAEGISAFFISEDEYKLWASRTPLEHKKLEGAWENKLAARTLFWLTRFQVDEIAVNFLEVPTLIIAGSEDTLCPIEPIRKMVEMHAEKHEKNKIKLKEFPVRHFDFLSAKYFSSLVQTTAAFIKEFA